MTKETAMESGYVPLNLPAVDVATLRRGTAVQTRYFCANSVPGSKATVVRVMRTTNGFLVRCNYGKNLSGQPLLKWMLADALAAA